MQKKARFLVLSACLILVLSTFSAGSINSLEDSNDHINMENSYDDLTQEGVYPFENEYPSVQQLNDWYDTLVNENPDITKKIHLGQSWEGRDTWVIKVSDNVEEEQEEPSVFIHGNLHAREWSSNQVSAYYLWRLVEDYGSNETITWLVDNRQIYVSPMTNPDGYIYDGDGDLNQAAGWRKNRNDSTPTDSVGVDLNRNWDIDWENANDDPTGDTYRGETPFSEYETQNLRDFILSKEIDSYQDIHSHYGTLLIPWAYTGDPSPHDSWYRDMADDMTSMTSYLGNDDEQYSYGQAEEEIGYSASGGSIDWVYEKTGAISLCYELYTPDDYMDGFYPDEQYIMDINLDVYDSLVYQARTADIDLGDGSEHLYPPSPYLVYGTVEDGTGEIVDGVEISVVNHNTTETLYTQTDRNGYYEFNFGNLVENGYDEDDTFSIEVADTSEEFTVGSQWGIRKDIVVSSIPPSIDVTRPLGGETWEYGNIETIEWITEEGDNPIDSVDLEYSTDGGSSYIDIMMGLDDTGIYDWDIPDVTSDEVVIQATVHDSGGLSGSDSSYEFTILGTPPAPPENLYVEHDGTVGDEEIVINGTFPDNYDPWTLTELQAEGYAGWDTANYQEGGSIHISAQQDGDGVTTEEARWEQVIGPTSNEITVNAAYRRNIVENHGDCNVDITIELLVQDTDTGWESIYIDQDSTVGDSGWLEFGPDATYTPTGEVNAVRAHMYVASEGNSRGLNLDTAIGELWMDSISIITEASGNGTEDNLITWGASLDEPDKVSHYTIYRSDAEGGPYELIDTVEADGSVNYSYVDVGRGTADDIIWWYRVHALDGQAQECEGAGPVQEPGVTIPTFDIQLYANADSDGWNFVSFNLNLADNNLQSILGDVDNGITGNYEKVMYYDATADEWYSYVPSRDDHFNNLDNWDHTMGIWIQMTIDDTLTVEGTEPTETTITLEAGWNMVSYPSSEAGTGVPDQVTQIGYFDATAEYNVPYTENVDTFEFTPGEGYWLYAEEPTEWKVEY